MAISYGPNLGLMIDAATGEAHDAALRAFLRGVDGLVMPAVLDKDLNTPPVSPTNGDRYIVGPSPTGAWSGHAGKITRWNGSAWEFFTPANGWRALVLDEGVEYRYLSGAWTAQLKVGSGIAATNPTTGDLVLVGGMGIGGALHCMNLVSYGMQTTLGDGTTATTFRLALNGAISQNKRIEWQTNGVTKWRMYTNGTESGSDAGMNWNLEALNDSGTGIDFPITIVRAAGGAMTISRPLTVSAQSLTVGLAAGTGFTGLILRAAAGNTRAFQFYSGNSGRWSFGASSAAESGSNSGSDFSITALDDSGATIDNPIQIVRAAGGAITLSRAIKTAAAQESTGAGSATLGANCPAVTASAPYKWLKFLTSDGSTVYVPAWK